ncbi:unnamed protein product [Gemmataceae bacterium]|nr:unnamed protein product [Gemmataceae bacterium]VTT96572.1 unnamed protein product [Gemmataceae bacterium]
MCRVPKEFALEQVNAFLQWFMSTFADFIEGLNEGLKAIGADSAAIAKLVGKIRDILEKDPESTLDSILNAGRGFVAPGRPAAAAAAVGPDPGPPLLGAFVDGVDAGWWRKR